MTGEQSLTAVVFTCKALTQHLSLRKYLTLWDVSVRPGSGASQMPAQDQPKGKAVVTSHPVPGPR